MGFYIKNLNHLDNAAVQGVPYDILNEGNWTPVNRNRKADMTNLGVKMDKWG